MGNSLTVIFIWQWDMQFCASPCTKLPLKLNNRSLERSVNLRKHLKHQLTPSRPFRNWKNWWVGPLLRALTAWPTSAVQSLNPASASASLNTHPGLSHCRISMGWTTAKRGLLYNLPWALLHHAREISITVSSMGLVHFILIMKVHFYFRLYTVPPSNLINPHNHSIGVQLKFGYCCTKRFSAFPRVTQLINGFSPGNSIAAHRLSTTNPWCKIIVREIKISNSP